MWSFFYSTSGSEGSNGMGQQQQQQNTKQNKNKQKQKQTKKHGKEYFKLFVEHMIVPFLLTHAIKLPDR